jgi:peroxidase
LNFQTSFLDGSNIYGSDNVTASLLRERSGGLLKYSVESSSGLELLPIANTSAMLELMDKPDKFNGTLFFAGDPRANSHPALQALHTLFLREHNRKARFIQKNTPSLSDEDIFQLARTWVISLIQKITFTEYLYLLLGKSMPKYTGYDPKADPSIDALFAGAAFRFFHSSMSDQIVLLNPQGLNQPLGHISMADAFYRTNIIQGRYGMDSLFRGLTAQKAQNVDPIFVKDLRKNYPEAPYNLAVLDIIQSRQFGLPSYSQCRVMYNLTAPKLFQNVSANVAVQEILSNLYKNVTKIDAFVGGLSESFEESTPGQVGPLFATVIYHQFMRTRKADRFWYERDGVLSDEDLKEIDTWSLSKLVQANTKISKYPLNPFLYYSGSFLPDNINPPIATFQPWSDFKIQWTALDSMKSIFKFTLCTNYPGWVGIGFNKKAETMVGYHINLTQITHNNGNKNRRRMGRQRVLCKCITSCSKIDTPLCDSPNVGNGSE